MKWPILNTILAVSLFAGTAQYKDISESLLHFKILKSDKKSEKSKKVLSDTPFERFFKVKYGDTKEVFKIYVGYLIGSKRVKDIQSIERTLNSHNKYLNYYEANLKLFYDFYKTDIIPDKDFENILNTIYTRTYPKIENSFEGFLIQNIRIHQGNYKYGDLVTSLDFCRIGVPNKDFQTGCLANQILLQCINGKEDFMYNILEFSKDNLSLSKYIVQYCKEKKQ